MTTHIIEKMFKSFEELENAINKARNTLETSGKGTEEIFSRFDTYEEIIEKQRTLGLEMLNLINEGATEEDIHRKVALINGLSEMIKTDSKDILKSLTNGSRQ